jgi:hypothetical protein
VSGMVASVGLHRNGDGSAQSRTVPTSITVCTIHYIPWIMYAHSRLSHFYALWLSWTKKRKEDVMYYVDRWRYRTAGVPDESMCLYMYTSLSEYDAHFERIIPTDCLSYLLNQVDQPATKLKSLMICTNFS